MLKDTLIKKGERHVSATRIKYLKIKKKKKKVKTRVERKKEEKERIMQCDFHREIR